MRLKKLSLIETPGIEDCITRGYDTNFNNNDIDLVLHATEGGSRLNARSLADVASRVLSPIGNGFESKIESGWRGERFKVAMLVELRLDKYNHEYAYVVGYTDNGYRDRCTRRNGSSDIILDPETRIYINSVTRVDLRLSNQGRDSIWIPKLTSSSQVLRRDSLDLRNANDRPGVLRPTDLARRQDVDNDGNLALEALRNDRNVRMDNKTGCFVSPILMSDQNNNLSSQHLFKSLSAHINASSDPSNRTLHSTDASDVRRGAVDRLDEHRADADGFFNALRNDSDIMRSGYVTYQELIDASPDWDEDQTGIKQFTDRDYAALSDLTSWRGDAPEQTAAQILANGLPSIMINAAYSMAFGIIIDTNAKFGESRVVCTQPAPFMQGLDPRATQNYFEEMVDLVLVKDATHGGLFDIYAEIDADLDGMIRIKISIDGGRLEKFAYPAWASGLLAPVLATDQDVLDRLSKTVTSLATSVANEKMSRFSRGVDSPDLALSLDSGSIRSAREDRDRNDGDRGGRQRRSYDLRG